MNTSHLVITGLCLLAAHALPVAAGAADYGTTAPPPRLDVTVESDLKVLAQGFEAAFAELPAGAKYIWIRSGDDILVLGSVASVRAYGGVLVVHIQNGATHLVSAGDVLRISNDEPGVPRK